MCGRWYVDLMSDEELTEYYKKLKNKSDIKIRGEIFPNDHVMVIANSKNMNINVFNMKWGYHIGKNIVFNAKCETLHSKKIFCDGIKNRRCVIPANNYFEWDKNTKEKKEIKDKNTNIIYFLGIYRFENNEPVCTIITKDASDSLKDLHPRMPVIITKDKIDEWLSSDCNVEGVINNSLNEMIYTKAL